MKKKNATLPIKEKIKQIESLMNSSPNPYYSIPSSPIPVPPTSPVLDKLPPYSSPSDHISIIIENENLRKYSQELLIELSFSKFENENLRKKLTQVEEKLFAANSHFEMFLKDTTCLSERYLKSISRLEDKIIEISSEHEL